MLTVTREGRKALDLQPFPTNKAQLQTCLCQRAGFPNTEPRPGPSGMPGCPAWGQAPSPQEATGFPHRDPLQTKGEAAVGRGTDVCVSLGHSGSGRRPGIGAARRAGPRAGGSASRDGGVSSRASLPAQLLRLQIPTFLGRTLASYIGTR